MNGHLEVFAIADGILYHDWMGEQGNWNGWWSGLSPASNVTAMSAAMGPAGNLEAFAIADGTIYHNWLSQQFGWNGWQANFNNAPSNATAVSALVEVAVWSAGGTNPGNLGVFAIAPPPEGTTDSNLYRDYLALGENWKGWQPNFDSPPQNVTMMTGAMGPDFAFQAFAIADGADGSPGTLYWDWEGGGGWTSSWTAPFDTGQPSNVATVTAAMGPTGNLEVFAVTTDGNLCHDYLDGSQGNWNWNGWQSSFDNAPPNVATVTAAMGPAGNLEVFAVTTDGNLYHDYLDGSGNWQGMQGNFGPEGCNVTALSAAMGTTGNLEVFAIADGTIYHTWLTAQESWMGWQGPFDSNCPGDVTAVIPVMGPSTIEAGNNNFVTFTNNTGSSLEGLILYHCQGVVVVGPVVGNWAPVLSSGGVLPNGESLSGWATVADGLDDYWLLSFVLQGGQLSNPSDVFVMAGGILEFTPFKECGSPDNGCTTLTVSAGSGSGASLEFPCEIGTFNPGSSGCGSSDGSCSATVMTQEQLANNVGEFGQILECIVELLSELFGEDA